MKTVPILAVLAALGPTAGGLVTLAGAAVVMGSRQDIVIIQPGP